MMLVCGLAALLVSATPAAETNIVAGTTISASSTLWYEVPKARTVYVNKEIERLTVEHVAAGEFKPIEIYSEVVTNRTDRTPPTWYADYEGKKLEYWEVYRVWRAKVIDKKGKEVVTVLKDVLLDSGSRTLEAKVTTVTNWVERSSSAGMVWFSDATGR